MNQTQGIRANEKPVGNDFLYVYAENKDKGVIKVTKTMMKVLLGVATKLSELENDENFVDNTVSTLKNYYLKTETYSKEELDDKIALIPKFSVKVVYALPFEDISESTIYLVPTNDGGENLYTEYININGLWEILGTQKIANIQITKEAIEEALGYTPADEETINALLAYNQKNTERSKYNRVVLEQLNGVFDFKYTNILEYNVLDIQNMLIYDKPNSFGMYKLFDISPTKGNLDINGITFTYKNYSLDGTEKTITIPLDSMAEESGILIGFNGETPVFMSVPKDGVEIEDVSFEGGFYATLMFEGALLSKVDLKTYDIMLYKLKNGGGSGATDEQLAQIEQNKTDIGKLSDTISDLKKDGIISNREILPNVVLFGDSITDTTVDGKWVENIKEYAEFKSLTNYARGYCTFTFKSDSEYNITDTSNANIGNNVIWNQYNRMKADIEYGKIDTPDCIIILGGTNDAIQSKTIGDKDTAFKGNILDADIKTLTNLYQSVRYVCETIRNDYPLTQIILCTPLQIGNSSNDNIISVHDTIISSAQKMALKYIDQTYEGGVYSYEEIKGDVSLQGDNVHLSTLGGKVVAQFLAREFYNKINLRSSQIPDDEEPDTPIEPEVTLSSISATYSGGSVRVGTELDALTGIKVTANYSDGTTAIVTDYTLYGEIVEGENIITVTYEELTTTFTVIGIVEEPIKTLSSISAQYTQEDTVIYDTDSLDVLKDALVVTANYSDGNTEVVTDYTLSGTLKEGKSIITVEYEGKTTTFECEVTKYIVSDDKVTFLRNELVGNMPTGIWPDYTIIPNLPIPRCQLNTFEFNANTSSGKLYVFVAKKSGNEAPYTFTPLLVKEIDAVKGFNSLELNYTPPETVDEVYIGFKTVTKLSIGLNTDKLSAESTGQTWTTYYAVSGNSFVPQENVSFEIPVSVHNIDSNGLHVNKGMAMDCLVRATIL